MAEGAPSEKVMAETIGVKGEETIGAVQMEEVTETLKKDIEIINVNTPRFAGVFYFYAL